MDNIFAIIGNTNLQRKAERFISSCHEEKAGVHLKFDGRMASSQNHFVYFAHYSYSPFNSSQPSSQFSSVPSSLSSALSSRTDFESKPPDSAKLNIPAVACVRIDNIKALQRGLSKGATELSEPATVNDEMLLYQCYQTWGKELGSRLEGDYCYIIWDEELQEVHAGVSAFNGRTLYYMQAEGLLYIASDAKLLAAHPTLPLQVNKRALAQWLKGEPNPEISMFEEISLLAGGHSLRCSLQDSTDGTVEVSRFWDIDPGMRVRYNNAEDYETHFFSLLQDSVCSRMQSKETPVFSQMSGGLDSTSVTALAQLQAISTGKSLHTVSHSYRNTQSCDEQEAIETMISALALEHPHFIELDKFDEISFGELYPTDFDNPGIVLSPKYHEELAMIQAEGSSVLLTGNGGDETCWGHSASYRNRLLRGEFGVVNEVIQASRELGEPIRQSLYKVFIRPIVPDTLVTLYKVARGRPKSAGLKPNWLTSLGRELADWGGEIDNPYSARLNPALHARYYSIRMTSTFNSMRSYQKVASQYDVDIRHPFFDPALVAFSFAIPEKLLIQGAYPKWLLRKSMEDHLPESVCWNKHKVVFDQHFANLVRSNDDEIRKLLSHPGLQDLGLVNNDVLLEEFEELIQNPNRYLNVDMLYAILTQSWYQQHWA